MLNDFTNTQTRPLTATCFFHIAEPPKTAICVTILQFSVDNKTS